MPTNLAFEKHHVLNHDGLPEHLSGNCIRENPETGLSHGHHNPFGTLNVFGKALKRPVDEHPAALVLTRMFENNRLSETNHSPLPPTIISTNELPPSSSIKHYRPFVKIMLGVCTYPTITSHLENRTLHLEAISRSQARKAFGATQNAATLNHPTEGNSMHFDSYREATSVQGQLAQTLDRFIRNSLL